jgi:cytochrome P450
MTPDKSPPRFLDPSIEVKAQQAMNGLVMTLFQRLEQPKIERMDRIGVFHVIEDPELAEEVFKAPALFTKNMALVAALGESRFNLNGARWAQFRDRTQPAYNKASKPNEIPNIDAIYRGVLDGASLEDGAALEPKLLQAALAVFCKALNVVPDPEHLRQLYPHIRTQAMLLQFCSWYGVQNYDILQRRAEWLDQSFNQIVLSDPNSKDFVQQTVRQQSVRELSAAVTDLMQNLFVGIETTLATLSWAVQLLGQNAELQDALRNEADAPFQNRNLTRGFLWETMRCFPPIPFVVRELSQDYSGHGRHFSKGEQVIISIIALHRHPDFWANPNEFHAARSEFSEGQTASIAFRPFLSGPRVCGGKRLAEIEMLVALPEILRRWRIVSLSSDISYDYAISLRPRSLNTVRLEALP